VHRDVKPENALITVDGVVKVADFGLAHALAEARMTQSPGTVTGTVHYLAPEQIQGEPADPRTDLYALGIVAYELLTGHTPFTGETSLTIAYKHLSDPVPPPSHNAPAVPSALDRIVLRATAKEPADRPGSAAEMRQELIVTAGSLPSAPPLTSLVRSTPEHELTEDRRSRTVTIPQVIAPRRHRLRRRRRWPWVILLLLALSGSGAWAAWTYALPHYARVPSVLGLRLPTARDRMAAAGLHVRTGPPMASIRYPTPGTVARQSVDPGARVRKGGRVVLRVSTGLPTVVVPKVEGLSLHDARAKLESGHFVVKVHRQYSQTVAEDDVILQSPAAAHRIEYGSVVRLDVSAGPEPVAIPSVQGSSADEATAVLQGAGFQVQRIDRFSEGVPLGDVIRQHPSSGTALKGSTVTIVVSKGPRSFPMPNVEGMDRSAAEQKLSNLGLDVHVVVIPSSSGKTVVGQNPSPDTTMHRGDTVTIYVA
jgi:serine/threonine-protein kinase